MVTLALDDPPVVVGASATDREGAAPEPAWMVVLDSSCEHPATGDVPVIAASELDSVEHDRADVERHVAELVAALWDAYGALARTPSGASWLDVHRVPVLRLLRQVVPKVLALGSWPPFARSPVVASAVDPAASVTERATSASEYRYLTVTWSGIAYLLGAPVREPDRATRVGGRQPVRAVDYETRVLGVSEPRPESAEFVAVSWSSRHVDTLRPVLQELARRRLRTAVIDLATEPAQRFGGEVSNSVATHRLPDVVLEMAGGLPEPPELPRTATVAVGAGRIAVDRLLRVVACVADRSAGCTQPSWKAALAVERCLSRALQAARPRALICCNDTSPIGHLAVRVAKSQGLDSLHLQHGAWVPEEVAWPALHCKRIVVMGDRDRDLAEAWATDPDASVHVLGQPRFDALASIDRREQRARLRARLWHPCRPEPERIAVLATQPFGPDDLRRQLDLAVEGVALAGQAWALVVAPHPAQRRQAVEHALLECDATGPGGPPVAVTEEGEGARDCLAGADALLTVSSTCGIEALLIDVPVLELAPACERTLGLAEQCAASRCTAAREVAHALDGATRVGLPPVEVKRAVCAWDGDSARRIADLLTDVRSTPGRHRSGEAVGSQ